MTHNNYLETMPQGWRLNPDAITAPAGFMWANNGKSLFCGEYEQALVKMPTEGCNEWAVRVTLAEPATRDEASEWEHTLHIDATTYDDARKATLEHIATLPALGWKYRVLRFDGFTL